MAEVTILIANGPGSPGRRHNQQLSRGHGAARTALGEKVNLLSESYVTRVAQVYASLYPQRLNRSVMIGVNPPGRFVWEPEMVDAQIEYYSHLWAQDEKAHSRTPDLAETMRRVSHTMPRRWLFFPIDPGKVNGLAFVLLFNQNTAATVFDAYVAAQNGDASGLALMSLAFDLFIPKSFVWGDLFAKGGSADLDKAMTMSRDSPPVPS
jgi:pimeloyl-ACP methyl ester carboxylesterase